MILRISIAFLLSVSILALPARGERLEPESIAILGFFSLPDREGPGVQKTFEYFDGGLSIVKDCMGRPDPSPDDGFPGCLMARGHRNSDATVGVFDIPKPGEQARSVVPLWDLVDTYMVDKFASRFPIFDGKRERVFDVFYEPGPNCRIWWLYVQHYGPSMKDDTPFVGISSCDPMKPNPQGGWALPTARDKFGRNGLHPNKAGRGITILPQDLADRYFGGQRLMLASGKSKGSRDSSAGPSFAIADLVVPKGGELENARPLVYYPHPMSRKAGRYPEWYEETAFEAFVSSCSQATGGEVLEFDGRTTAVQTWSEATTMDEGTYPRTAEGRARYDSDPLTPSTTDPVGWYGVDNCTEGPAIRQQPSFWDKKRNGSLADRDCNMVSLCPGRGTGPRCNNVHNFLLFYDLEELAAAYKGKIDPWKVQPYGRLDLGWHEKWPCHVDASGTAYDRQNQVLFVAQYGAEPRIHVYRVGSSPQAGKRASSD